VLASSQKRRHNVHCAIIIKQQSLVVNGPTYHTGVNTLDGTRCARGDAGRLSYIGATSK